MTQIQWTDIPQEYIDEIKQYAKNVFWSYRDVDWEELVSDALIRCSRNFRGDPDKLLPFLKYKLHYAYKTLRAKRKRSNDSNKPVELKDEHLLCKDSVEYDEFFCEFRQAVQEKLDLLLEKGLISEDGYACFKLIHLEGYSSDDCVRMLDNMPRSEKAATYATRVAQKLAPLLEDWRESYSTLQRQTL